MFSIGSWRPYGNWLIPSLKSFRILVAKPTSLPLVLTASKKPAIRYAVE